MSSPENRQQAFPAEPPSFPAGGHEMRDYYIDSLAPRPNPQNTPYLTPYLGLQARLSQVWINRWTVLLILVLVRLMFAIGTTNDLIENARADALSACSEVEMVATNVVSLPHYMAQGINSLTASGVSNAVNGLHSMLDMTLTAVEEIVIFYIGMLTNTYLCLITFAAGGSLSAAVNVVDQAQGFLNTSLRDIGDDISSSASSLQTEINGLVAGINTVLGSSAPKVDFSKQINELDSLQLPANFTADFQKLNNSIPSFAEVQNITDGLISQPFGEARDLMNQAWGNYSFNQSLLPVPDKNTVSFCSGNNDLNNFFDDLKKVAHDIRNVFLGVLITFAILACIPSAILETRRWAMLQVRSKFINKWATDSMDAMYMSARPYSSSIGQWAAGRFSSSKTQVLVRWFWAYCTTLPALLLLSIALAGFFSCFFQYFLLKAIEKEVPAITAEIAGAIDDVVNKVNNASAGWATDTNAVLLKASGDLNVDLLSWVNISTTAVNNTLNRFIDETVNVLNQTFFGTPLNEPVQDVFNCLIGLKALGIEKGLTWVQDHAHVNFPSLPNNSMTLGDMFGNDTDLGAFLSNPQQVTQNDVSAAVDIVGNKIEDAIRQEALVAFMVLIAWFVVVFTGFFWTVYKLFRSDVVRQDGGDVVFIQTQTPSLKPPFSGDATMAENFNPKARFPGLPTTPAPAYKIFPDVNSNAPYTLNPHPIPHAQEFGEFESEKSTPPVPLRRDNNNPFQNNQYVNEKNGYI